MYSKQGTEVDKLIGLGLPKKLICWLCNTLKYGIPQQHFKRDADDCDQREWEKQFCIVLIGSNIYSGFFHFVDVAVYGGQGFVSVGSEVLAPGQVQVTRVRDCTQTTGCTVCTKK